MLNKEKVSSVMADFSITAADRIASLPLVRNTVQKELMQYFTTTDHIEDALSLLRISMIFTQNSTMQNCHGLIRVLRISL